MLRPDIILSTQIANPAQAMMQGAQTAGLIDTTRQGIQQNRMLQEFGPGIMAGNPEALNALARFDPAGALNIKSKIAAERRAEAAAARAAAAAAQNKAKAAELAKEVDLLRRVALSRENGDEAFIQALNTSGLAQEGVTPSNFDMYLATGEGAIARLGAAVQSFRPEPYKPDYERVGNQFVDMNRPMAGAQNIPGIAVEQPKPDYRFAGNQFYDANNPMAGAQPIPNFQAEPPKRQIVKGADGYNYYADTGERVFPNVVAQEQAPLVQNIFGGAEGNSIPQPENTPLTPSGVKGAFGAFDTLGNVASDISDSVGFGTIRPEVQAAQTSIGETNTSAMLTLVEGYAGRPSNLTREQVNNILPKPGLMGNDRALSKAKNTRALIASQIGEATEAINSGLLTDSATSDAVQFIIATRRLYEAYDEIVRNLESDGTSVDPALEDRLKAYE